MMTSPVAGDTKIHVDTCGGASEIMILDKHGSFSFAEPIDLRSGEVMSEAFGEAVRRLFTISADLNTTEDQLETEFDAALAIIKATRRRLSVDHEREEGAHDSMSKVRKYWLDAKIIKS